MQNDESVVRWKFDEFEILQVIQCSDVLAVYAIQAGAHPEKYKLESWPIHFLAVAKVTTRFMERPKDADTTVISRERKSPEVCTAVVGLELSDGSFEVCNEASNFAGYCMKGDDISEACYYLDWNEFPLST